MCGGSELCVCCPRMEYTFCVLCVCSAFVMCYVYFMGRAGVSARRLTMSGPLYNIRHAHLGKMSCACDLLSWGDVMSVYHVTKFPQLIVHAALLHRL